MVEGVAGASEAECFALQLFDDVAGFTNFAREFDSEEAKVKSTLWVPVVVAEEIGEAEI